MTSVACFLGAGFSYAARVPLAKDLFQSNYVLALSERSQTRFDAVLTAYREWHALHPSGHAEEFMGELYRRHVANAAPIWRWAVEYIGAVIASPGTPPSSLNRNPRYSNRLNRPSTVDAHRRFWATITRKFNEVAVLTTNYDILIEQGLRHKPFRRPPAPGCFYGGFERPQMLKGAAQPFSAWSPEELIELTGSVPVFKLHGSLNWSLESGRLVMYQDLRAAFRNGGNAAIVPPIPDKELPLWLKPVWTQAEIALRQSQVWIICGYSVLPYDVSVQALLKESSSDGGREVVVSSPDAKEICHRLSDLLPNSKLIAIEGLPDGIDNLTREFCFLPE